MEKSLIAGHYVMTTLIGNYALQAVLIGSDIPDICERTLVAAFTALDNHEVRVFNCIQDRVIKFTRVPHVS